MEFLNFVIPEILKDDIKTKAIGQKEIQTRQTSKKGMENSENELAPNSFVLTSLQEELDKNATAASTDHTKKKESNDLPADSDIQLLVKGFDKLQSEMVILRKELIKAVDESRVEFEKRLEKVSSRDELDSLGKVLDSNSREITSLQEKIDQVIVNQEKVGSVDNTSLERFILDGRTMFSKLSEITSIQMAANTQTGEDNPSINLDSRKLVDLLEENKSLIVKVEEVRDITNSLKKDIDDRDKALNAVIENTAKELGKQVAAVLTTVKSSPNFQPSVRPKQSEKTESPQNEPNVLEPEVTPQPEIVEVTLRKGLFMTSSIGLKLDMYDLQDRLDCDIASVKTYHIEYNATAKNPDMHLKQNLTKLEGEKDLDFVVISTGTNDITVLDAENGDMSEMINKACNQTKHLVELANEAAQKHNLDVFVVERPPRGDVNKNYSVLNDAANGLFLSLIAPLQKVHYIPLPSLHNLPEKSRKNLFTNVGVPVHLKPWGLKHLRNDIITGVKAVYRDVKEIDVGDGNDPVTLDGKRKFQNERGTKMFQQNGQKSFHDKNFSNQDHNIAEVTVRTTVPQPRSNAGNFQPSGRDVYHDHPQKNAGESQSSGRGGLYDGEIQNPGNVQASGGNGYNNPAMPNEYSDHAMNNAGGFQPPGRGGYNEAARRGNQHPNQGNGFHPNGGNRNNEQSRRGNQHNGNSFRPAGVGFQKDGQFHRRNGHEGNGSREHNNRGKQHRNSNQEQHRGSQELQMPDMVKDYLMRTLMNTERY